MGRTIHHGISQHAGGLARYSPGRTTSLIGVIGLMLLAYCSVQKDGTADPARGISPLATVPSDVALGPGAVYDLAAGSQVLLQGTINVGTWSSQSSQARARVQVNLDDSTLRTLFDKLHAGQISGDQLRLSPDRHAIAELSVPVMSLHGDSQGMDRDMYSALKARQYPWIEFQLEKVQDVQLRQGPTNGKRSFLLGVTGTLTVAGVQRTLATGLTIQRDAGQHYLVHAQIPIRMSDFGVTPPTAFLGLIRARDSLSVNFDLDFIPADPSSRLPTVAHAIAAKSEQ